MNLLSVPYIDKAAKEYKDLLPQEEEAPCSSGIHSGPQW